MKLNRAHNARNPYQGGDKKVLCVCSAGLLRSPTIANTLHKVYGYNTRAVGVNPDCALILVDDVLIHWADEIVCADKEHAWQFEDSGKPIQVLNIEDEYAYMDVELISLIETLYNPWLVTV